MEGNCRSTKRGDPCFSTSINKKAVGHLSLEQPIRHLWMPTRGREPGQNQLSSFLISSMHDDGGSQMPGAGRHRHKQTMDTGQQGAIFPAQRTCGPPPALFAARMPDSFDVESCQTNASCHPWTSFPPREFTRLSTYLWANYPHMHACPDLIQTRSSAVRPVISHRQVLPVQSRNREKDRDKNSMFLVPTFPTPNTRSTLPRFANGKTGARVAGLG